MKELKLIGLTGHKGSGKDTVAEMLADYGYHRVAFADALKRIAQAIGWDGTKDDLPPCEHCGMMRSRQLLQVLGTEGVREVLGDDSWVRAAAREVERWDKVVITDCRFINEAAWVKSQGGQVWFVSRPDFYGDGHASEQELKLIRPDQFIWNNGDLAYLRKNTEIVLAGAIGGRR